MINQKLALEIYLEYCREFITNPEGLQDWSQGIKTIFIAKQHLFVKMDQTFCKYKLIQGRDQLPGLQLISTH